MRFLLAVIAMDIGLFSIASTAFASHDTNRSLKVLLLSGQNNHDWQRTTLLIRSLLESTRRFKVDVEERPDSLTTEQLMELTKCNTPALSPYSSAEQSGPPLVTWL